MDGDSAYPHNDPPQRCFPAYTAFKQLPSLTGVIDVPKHPSPSLNKKLKPQTTEPDSDYLEPKHVYLDYIHPDQPESTIVDSGYLEPTQLDTEYAELEDYGPLSGDITQHPPSNGDSTDTPYYSTIDVFVQTPQTTRPLTNVNQSAPVSLPQRPKLPSRNLKSKKCCSKRLYIFIAGLVISLMLAGATGLGVYIGALSGRQSLTSAKNDTDISMSTSEVKTNPPTFETSTSYIRPTSSSTRSTSTEPSNTSLIPISPLSRSTTTETNVSTKVPSEITPVNTSYVVSMTSDNTTSSTISPTTNNGSLPTIPSTPKSPGNTNCTTTPTTNLLLHEKCNAMNSASDRLVTTDQCGKQLLCETSVGNNWIIVQQRKSGNVDFYRGWRDYQSGFGHVGTDDDFWLGLDSLYQSCNIQK